MEEQIRKGTPKAIEFAWYGRFVCICLGKTKTDNKESTRGHRQ